MPLFYSLKCPVKTALLSAGLSLGYYSAAAQEVPPRTPVYPVPAPAPSDSIGVSEVGQEAEAREFAVPSVIGMGPSKGIVAHIERLSDFQITTKTKSNTEGVADINTKTTVTKNSRAFIKAYAPLWNHPHLKVILGVNYDREEFQFKNPNASPFYRNLEDKGLKTLGAQLAAIRPIDEVHWYLARVKGELNGDYTSESSDLSFNDYLKMSGEFIYGWKRSARFAWGIGAQLSYTFGRQSIYPVILYNRTWNEHWGVESLFPARVTFRYNVNAKTLLLGGYSVDGLNYNIKLREPLPNNNLSTLIIRETEFRPRLRLEREIYDFLWFGIEGGYRYNASFNGFDYNGNSGFSLFRAGTRPRIIDNTLGGAPYASLEIFIVPPRKLLKRTMGK